MIIVVQVGAVPLLLHVWGAGKYGDWLTLSALPGYLSLANLGFGDASGSDMTMRTAAGDREGALETFQSSWALLMFMSVALLSITSLLVPWIPWNHWMHLAGLSDGQAAKIILAWAVYIVISQQCGVLESGYRCIGEFATGISWIAIIRLLEATVGTAVGVITRSLLYDALATLLIRILGTIAYVLLLRRRAPWLHVGFRRARLSTMRRLSAPAFGFLALPLGSAINIQGMTILIGAVLGPIAVAAFSTLRTLTRLNSQVLNAVTFTLWPEISAAFGADRIALARRLFSRTYQMAIVLSVFLILSLWLMGPFIYRTWVRHAISFDPTCFHILLIVSFGDTLWFLSSVVPMSTNAHHRLALVFLGASSVSLVIARLLLPAFGVDGAAWAQLVLDVGMVWLALSMSLRQLQCRWLEFLGSAFTPSAFRESWRSVLDGVGSLLAGSGRHRSDPA